MTATDTDPRVAVIRRCLAYPPIYPERAAAFAALASLAAELRAFEAGSPPVLSTGRAEAS